jgi:small subunit ribosomal protein S27e
MLLSVYIYIKKTKIMDVINLEPESRFIKVKCKKCRNEQIIFNKAATEVKCLVCESVLAKPKGGMAEIKTSIVEELE